MYKIEYKQVEVGTTIERYQIIIGEIIGLAPDTLSLESGMIDISMQLHCEDIACHIHANKAIIDATEEAFTTVLKNKLDNLESGYYDDQTASEVPTTETGYSVQDHINDINNPHQVTKTQIGLSNVTNDAQLIRESGDFNTFEEKVTPESGDIILIEDASNGYGKKKTLIGNLPGGGGGAVDSVNGKVGVVVLGAEDINTTESGTTIQDKLNSLESNVVNFSDINNILANQIFN